MFKVGYLILALFAIVQGQTDPATEATCAECQCYELKCSRLENPDAACTNTYRDTCDNSEDITEANFCNINCDCCLEKQCFKWNNYKCIMFRTYEFSNIVYFIMVTVNGFVLMRLYSAMFSRENEYRPDEIDENNENLKEQKISQGGTVSMTVAGKLTIARINFEIEKIEQETHKEIANQFFNDVEAIKSTGTKNIAFLILLFAIYMFLNIFHVINIFILGTKPLTYVYIVWIQHLFLATFWVLVTLTFKKFGIYMKQVRDIVEKYHKEHHVEIIIHEKGNKIDFNFKGN